VAMDLYREKEDLFKNIARHLDMIFETSFEKSDEVNEILSLETTPVIKEYLKERVSLLITQGKHFATVEEFESWGEYLKKEKKLKGRPLFMGMRVLLTGMSQGSELKKVVSFTPLNILQQRLN